MQHFLNVITQAAIRSVSFSTSKPTTFAIHRSLNRRKKYDKLQFVQADLQYFLSIYYFLGLTGVTPGYV
jgi:hypothetical protein